MIHDGSLAYSLQLIIHRYFRDNKEGTDDSVRSRHTGSKVSSDTRRCTNV